MPTDPRKSLSPFQKPEPKAPGAGTALTPKYRDAREERYANEVRNRVLTNDYVTSNLIKWDGSAFADSGLPIAGPFPPAAHVHAWSDITSGVPTSFTPSAHQLDSASFHTVSGLTAGQFLKATSPTAFGFAAHGLTYTDVGAAPAVTVQTYDPTTEPVVDGQLWLVVS